MRWIMTIPALLAVALLSVTTPVLAAENTFELRVLEGPFTFAPTGLGAIAPQPAINAPTFYQLEGISTRLNANPGRKEEKTMKLAALAALTAILLATAPQALATEDGTRLDVADEMFQPAQGEQTIWSDLHKSEIDRSDVTDYGPPGVK